MSFRPAAFLSDPHLLIYLADPFLLHPEPPMPADRLETRFAATALRHPSRTAVSDPSGSLTYRQLDALADSVSSALSGLTAPGQLVALRAGRTRHAPGAILGILRSGAAYLPVDPGYPEARQKHLLDDSGAQLVLTDAPLLPGESPIATVGPFTLASRPSGVSKVVPADTAYAIYTSGSTGLPKGCLVGHAHVLALMDAAAPLFDLGPDEVWTIFHSWSFDFSVWELWGPLLYGGHAVVVDRETAADPEAFAQLLSSRNITFLNQVPSAFGNLVTEAIASGLTFPALRHVVFGGEALVPDDVRRFWSAGLGPAAEIVNMYGITETTVHVTHCPLTPELLDAARPGRTPIGRPLPHLGFSLRDAEGTPVPSGQPGELWVSGASVSHGYLDRPELNAARFVDGHYRSGDWAVEEPDGTLSYLGRQDGQVKLRGFRIELGEIEAALRAVPGVTSAACTVTPDAQSLTAYVVADPATTPARSIRTHLADHLPAHMLPQSIHHLRHLPLTPHGKLDRTALLAA
ncbi:amino acid adenylation domain-containing protein [Kitasatospora sp. NPDC051170]|uniref:amino acid adenylation domain-containing protein n=1 Tax=Kitasatospora sp. NPDC051170 TaxID=3364056 RepID=UPI0037A44783